jgi:glutaredoxin 3
MAAKRKIEVFSAGCATRHEAIDVISRAACPSCEVIVHDMKERRRGDARDVQGA